MDNGNDLIKHIYWLYLYLTYVFWTQMCPHTANIIFNMQARILGTIITNK